MSLRLLSTLKEVCKLLAVTGILPTAALPPFVFRFRETELHKILRYCMLYPSLKESLSLETFPETVNTDVHIISISHKYLSELKGVFC
jgi:hypothetical protein